MVCGGAINLDNGFPFPLSLSNYNQQEDFDDGRDMKFGIIGIDFFDL